jgi:hypothetical protein
MHSRNAVSASRQDLDFVEGPNCAVTKAQWLYCFVHGLTLEFPRTRRPSKNILTGAKTCELPAPSREARVATDSIAALQNSAMLVFHRYLFPRCRPMFLRNDCVLECARKLYRTVQTPHDLHKLKTASIALSGQIETMNLNRMQGR